MTKSQKISPEDIKIIESARRTIGFLQKFKKFKKSLTISGGADFFAVLRMPKEEALQIINKHSDKEWRQMWKFAIALREGTEDVFDPEEA